MENIHKSKGHQIKNMSPNQTDKQTFLKNEGLHFKKNNILGKRKFVFAFFPSVLYINISIINNSESFSYSCFVNQNSSLIHVS